MKAKVLAVVLILSGFFVITNKSYACPLPPVAILTDYPDPVVDGCSVTLDGCSSYDADGYITQWCFSWDWDSDPTWNYCSTTNCKTTHIYPGPGAYHARLRVKDNQGLYDYDYTWVHVGEPALELRKGPYLIYDGNNTEMMVLWQLTGDANCTLAWGLDPNCDAGSVQTSEYGTDHQHKYIIPDVNTATKYYYRVEVPDDANYFGSFWTAPDANATEVKFLAYGDTRADSGEIPYDHNNICSTIIDTYEADPNYQTFLLHSGDWVHDGNGESDWTTMYFNRSLLDSLAMEANIPIQGCTGNHEVDGGTATAYEKYWPYSYESGGRYWSFDYGPAHFVVVDQYTDYSDESAQLEWIEADLAASTKEWKFVLLHRPGYSAGGGHDDNTDVQTRIQPLCETYGVDIVFAGHNHYYARCDVNGVKHITTGGGGAPLSEPNENYSEYIEECNSVNHFCKIAISDCQLNFEAVDVNGTVIDSFTLTHRWYVNSAVSGGNDDGTSWENAFDDLQEALNVVLYGDEIWVAEGEGTYKPSKKTDPGDPRSATFQLVEGAAMYGGFAGTETARDQRDWATHETILSGDIGTIDDANDNCYHVVTGDGDANTIIDGFTITAGKANGSGSDIHGGGMYNSSCSPTIANCTFTDNFVELSGGGMYNSSASVTVSNCTFIGNSATSLGGGMCNSGVLTITNCIFSGNSAGSAGGIYNNGNSTLTNCIFSGNSANSSGGAIYNNYSDSTLTNCTFSGNSAGTGGGMYNWQSHPTLNNCILWGNDASSTGDEIYGQYSYPKFRYCDVNGCGGSDSWNTSFGTDLGGNIDTDPCFVDINNPIGPDGVFFSWDDGLRLDANSLCIDAADGDFALLRDIVGFERIDINDVNNTGTGNPDYADMGAYEYAEVYNVTKGKCYSSIQSAIDDANDGDTVVVSEGTYYEDIDFKGKGITLTSTDPCDPNVVAGTVIDASGSEDVVTFDSSEDADSLITGFTITNGYRGIYCHDASPTITNCTIISNTSHGIQYSGSDANISNCNISGNDFGIRCVANNVVTIIDCNISNNGYGVRCEDSTVLTIIDCNISNNQFDGLCLYSSPATVENCLIANNGSKGIGCSSSSLTISNCTLWGNQLYGGITFFNSSSATITNCVIAYNHPYGIGGVTSSTVIRNCTIVGHNYGSGYGIEGEYAEIKNCIFWDNKKDLEYNCSATYSCVKDDPGIGNIRRDPLFVDYANGDLRLVGDPNWPWSPCIDAGDPCSDYSNEPDGGGGRINMGAYGNTEEAATVTIVDSDEDGLPDQWESYYWPSDDPNQHDPNDDPDDDGLQNIVEYRIGWDPTVDDSNSIPGHVLNERTGLKYPYINSAITYALDYDTLIADPARYYETIGFKGKKITLTSVEPNNPAIVKATIIDGNGTDRSVVTFDYLEDANSVLRGFSITGGGRGIYCFGASQTIAKCIVSGNYKQGVHRSGAGICCVYSSTTISDCTFSNNETGSGSYGGGGIYTWHTDLLVTGCIISENEATYGGGICCGDSNLAVINCVISRNKDGGGIYCYGDSNLELTDCIIAGNEAGSGGGIYCCESSNLILKNCVVIENSASSNGGGIYCIESYLGLINCIISKNEAKAEGLRVYNYGGGGIYNSESPLTLVNCTISDNVSYEFGGGMYNDNCEPTVTNCILWGNNAVSDGNEIYNYSSTPGFGYCDIRGGWDGLQVYNNNSSVTNRGGNIKSDPNFINASNPIGPDGVFGTFDDGLRLFAYSPCVDVASSTIILGEYCQASGSSSYQYIMGVEVGSISNIPTGNSIYADYTSMSTTMEPEVGYPITVTRGNPYTNDECAVWVDWNQNGNFSDLNEEVAMSLNPSTFTGTITPPAGAVSGDMRMRVRIVWNETPLPCGGSDYGEVEDYTITVTGDTDAVACYDITGRERVDVPYVENAEAGDPNYYDMGAYESPTVWFVNAEANGLNDGTSWDDAFDDLQEALTNEDVNDGHEIWVAAGIYEPTDGSDRSISFELVEGVIVRGGFANTGRHQRHYIPYQLLIHETILSGNIDDPNDPNDNSYHVVIGADGAVLERFTIESGFADGPAADSNGGGIYCDGNNLEIRSCTIWANRAENDGGAIFCNDSNLTVTSCIISYNKAYSGNGGGMFDSNSNAMVTNCTLVGNMAQYGGAICNTNSGMELKNSIVEWNGAEILGYSIYNDSSDPNIRYCEIEGCKDSNGIWDPNFGSDCGGNINVWPSFEDVTDPVGPDNIFGTYDDGLRLKSDSPCIDAADGDASPLTDIIGFKHYDVNVVTNTGAGFPDYVDMGVYESYSGCDADIDGMQDDWEIMYGLDPCNPDDAESEDPNISDPDNDTYNNLEEFLQGTDPLDPNSYPIVIPASLPYSTSFELIEGYDTGWPDDPVLNDPNDPNDDEFYCNLSYINNWRVTEGVAVVYNYYYYYDSNDYRYQYAVSGTGSKFAAFFDDAGSNHRYVSLSVDTGYFTEPVPPIGTYVYNDAEISIKYGSNLIAAVKFASGFMPPRIHVWDDSSYVDTQVPWTPFGDWESLVFDINWNAGTYDVYYLGDPEPIYSNAKFATTGCDRLTTLEFKSKYGTFFVNRVSITDTEGSGPDPYISIEKPCACTDDELEGREPVIGSICWDQLVKYNIMYCPADPQIDMENPVNWHVADVGIGAKGSQLLGYWDTSSIPNGYYYLGILPYKDYYHVDYGYVPNDEISIISKTVEVGGEPVYETYAYFAVVGDLKCNTFYHEEEPDISVSWPGKFPFELKRIYNNNRRFFRKPLFNGWTHNGHMTITEIATSDNCDWGQYGPAYDENFLGFGEITVAYPDGSMRSFRHIDGDEGGKDTVTYYPYPDDTGDIIRRTTCCYSWDDDLLSFTVENIDYELKLRDGKIIKFENVNYFERPDPDGWHPTSKIPVPMTGTTGGVVWWKAVGGVSSISDRFSNTLNFSWYENEDSRPVAVESITHDRQDGNDIGIILERNVSNECYNKAELRVGDVLSPDANNYEVWRTVYYDWDDVNDTYLVTKTGGGVDANGIYDSFTINEYVTKYQYDTGDNLVKVVYGEDIDSPSIEVEYDDYGRVGIRKDYVDPNSYLSSEFEYTFYHPYPDDPDPDRKLLSYMITDVNYCQTDINTPYRQFTTIQDENGAVLERHTVTSDGSPTIDVNSFYEDNSHPRKPTDVNEYFDGVVRRTENSYSDYTPGGDLTEQKMYVDDVNFTSTEMTYHTVSGKYCVLKERQTSFQGLNKTGQKVQTVYVYGDANGTPADTGVYLVEEWRLLAGDPCDSNDVWAVTSYGYYDNGLVKTKTDPNNFVTFHEYDGNGYIKLTRKGTVDSNEPVQRFYYDAVGQMRLKANHLGGVTLNDYDEFGRLWKVRTYDDANALTIPDEYFIPADYNEMDPCSIAIYGYDERGNRTYEKKIAGGQIFTDYTISRQVQRSTCDDGSYEECTYNDRGLKIQEYKYDAISDVNWFVDYDYDDMDRLTDTWLYDYNDTTVVKHKASEYWGSGKKKYEDIYGFGDVLEKQTDYYYDILVRLTNVVVAPNDLALTATYNYDAVGNRTSVIDPNGNIIYFDYDNANRKVAEYFATEPGTGPNVKKTIRYYENNLVKDVNSYDYDGTLLARSRFEYDSRGRVTEVTQQIDDVNDAVTVYDYNDSGFGPDSYYHIRITDANNENTYIALDAFGRRVEILYPSGDYQELKYNGDGTLAAKAVWDTNDTKYWIEYYYEDYGRLADVNYPDGGNVHYSYDGFGRRTLVEDGRNINDSIGGSGQNANKISYDYDPLNRIIGITEQDGYEITYTYKANGQKENIAVYKPGQENPVYWVEYGYDTALRLANVNEPLLTNDLIASFEYDKNGNRKKLTYSLDGTPSSTVYIDYNYNRDNLLTYFSTTGGPTFTLNNVTVDGLGRLTDANETISKTSGTVDYSYTYVYDMRSQLKEADITKDSSPWWDADYNYYKNGNLKDRTTDIPKTEFEYTGDIMDGTKTGGGETFTLTWDENGNMIDVDMSAGDDTTLEYNWDGKLRSATKGSDSISLRYDPDGNRIFKDSSESGERKYIVDIVGDLPVILIELDSADNMDIMKKYIYAHSQVLAQHDIDDDATPAKDDIYFYLHDRLGSVRQVIDTSADVVKYYTYKPFGETIEDGGTFDNPFQFTGQYFDSEIDQYYLRARQYDPHIARFTTRDPVFGKFKEPLTLHVYLYCLNDPVNRIDLNGELSIIDVGVSAGINSALYGMQAWMQGVKGWGLLRPMLKGAILGTGASFLGAGLQAKWATSVINSTARHMITGGARAIGGELFDAAMDPDYEFNLAKNFTNLGLAMFMGGAKAKFMEKFLTPDTIGGEGFIFGQKNYEEAFKAFYRYIRLAQSEAINDLYEVDLYE